MGEEVGGEALGKPGGAEISPGHVVGCFDADAELERVVPFHPWFFLDRPAGQSFPFLGRAPSCHFA
jgi:hypothetical protein